MSAEPKIETRMIASTQPLAKAASGICDMAPGVALCCAIAVAAAAIATVAGTSVTWALIIGMALTTVWPPKLSFHPGIELSAKHILRIGIALLVTQVSAESLQVLDGKTIGLLAGSVFAVLLAGRLLAPVLGISHELALVTASSVAICGASAAVAFGLAIARAETRERDIACTVGAVSVISTLAMLLYPFIARHLGFASLPAGVFLGGTIHEVPHAVAAGFAIDADTGNVATVTKLLRVGMLGPALMLVISSRSRTPGQSGFSFLCPPWFLIGFVVFAILNLSGELPAQIASAAGKISRACILVAMAGIGLKLQWRSLLDYGWRPVALLLLLSGLMATFVASYLCYYQI
jgi:uncharacterized integral membrane protein (TIGR00698 family)